MAGEPPRLTVASKQNEAQLAKQWALDALRWPTREMAANLFRVTRGHGKPYELPQQIINLSDAILEAAKHSNAWGIWNVIEDVLHSAVPRSYENDPDERYGTIIKGSLQTMASKLLSQRAQECAGHGEINDGIEAVERRREEVRKEWLEAQAEAHAQSILARPKKPRAKPKPPTPKAAPPAPMDDDIDPSAWKTTADYMRLRRAQLQRQRGSDHDEG